MKLEEILPQILPQIRAGRRFRAKGDEDWMELQYGPEVPLFCLAQQDFELEPTPGEKSVTVTRTQLAAAWDNNRGDMYLSSKESPILLAICKHLGLDE